MIYTEPKFDPVMSFSRKTPYGAAVEAFSFFFFFSILSLLSKLKKGEKKIPPCDGIKTTQ